MSAILVQPEKQSKKIFLDIIYFLWIRALKTLAVYSWLLVPYQMWNFLMSKKCKNSIGRFWWIDLDSAQVLRILQHKEW
jgi:hypothetical protein